MTTTLNHEFHRVPMAGMGVRPNAKAKVVGVLLLLVALAAIYWVMLETGALTTVTNKAALSEWIDQLGYWGPVGIIGLMITAIVLSPIPSAPIAMVAGTAYGSLWGTVIVVIGAEAGALIAFAIARSLGYDVIHRWICVAIGALYLLRCRQLCSRPDTDRVLAIRGRNSGWCYSDSVFDHSVWWLAHGI